jgi:hypothetical protein
LTEWHGPARLVRKVASTDRGKGQQKVRVGGSEHGEAQREL